MTSQVTIAKKKSKRGLWPALGLGLIIALLVISYAVAPAVIAFSKANFRGFTTRGTDPQLVHWLFTIIIFLVLGATAALIVALFAPKRWTVNPGSSSSMWWPEPKRSNTIPMRWISSR